MFSSNYEPSITHHISLWKGSQMKNLKIKITGEMCCSLYTIFIIKYTLLEKLGWWRMQGKAFKARLLNLSKNYIFVTCCAFPVSSVCVHSSSTLQQSCKVGQCNCLNINTVGMKQRVA